MSNKYRLPHQPLWHAANARAKAEAIAASIDKCDADSSGETQATPHHSTAGWFRRLCGCIHDAAALERAEHIGYNIGWYKCLMYSDMDTTIKREYYANVKNVATAARELVDVIDKLLPGWRDDTLGQEGSGDRLNRAWDHLVDALKEMSK